jgi:predicted dehydrogenase
VHVTTPPASHHGIAMEALERGIHVLVEKPPALTVEACAALQREADARGVTIGVDENMAFDPLILRARELIAGGSLGRVLHIGSYFSFGMPPSAALPAWMEELPGGMLEDLLPHLVTTARALSGSPLTVRSWHRSRSGLLADEHDDLLSLELAGSAGPTADLTLSLVAQPPEFTVAVHGSEASLALDLRNMLMRVAKAGAEGSAIARGRDILSANFGAIAQTARNTLNLLRGRRERFGSPLGLIRAHYAAIEAGTEVPAPLSRAVETVAIAREIWPALADDAVDRPSSLVTPVGNAAS